MAERIFESIRDSQEIGTTLNLLGEMEEDASVSQRSIAKKLGVAVGLTNSLIKRCIRKGLIKVSDAPARRYAYYLTPKGFQEKARLTATYLSVSLDFFRTARSQYGDIADECLTRGWTHVAIYGATELTEIATLAGNEIGLKFAAIIDPKRNTREFCGVPVQQTPNAPKGERPFDAIIIADITAPQLVYDELTALLPAERVLVVDLLRVSSKTAKGAQVD